MLYVRQAWSSVCSFSSMYYTCVHHCLFWNCSEMICQTVWCFGSNLSSLFLASCFSWIDQVCLSTPFQKRDLFMWCIVVCVSTPPPTHTHITEQMLTYLLFCKRMLFLAFKKHEMNVSLSRNWSWPNVSQIQHSHIPLCT